MPQISPLSWMFFPFLVFFLVVGVFLLFLDKKVSGMNESKSFFEWKSVKDKWCW